MDLNYIKKLIKMLDESGLSKLEIVEDGKELRLSKPVTKLVPAQMPPYPMPYGAGFPAPEVPAAEEKKAEEAESKKEEIAVSDKVLEIKSPMVGTFYMAPSPEADAYVQVGSVVNEGDVICIIEAMKLMNEIESEFSGKIVKILVENGQAVEYDQPLFLIEKE